MGEALGRPWGLTPFEGNKRLAKLIGIVANRGKLYLWMLAVRRKPRECRITPMVDAGCWLLVKRLGDR